MGVRILHDADDNSAVLYCSTTEWAFGPLFHAGELHDEVERAEAFLRWLATTITWSNYGGTLFSGRRDARQLSDAGLAAAYADWLDQESDQWRREDAVADAIDEIDRM